MERKRKLAAALSYDSDVDNAPRVVAKGEGEMADKIQQLAQQWEVPVYQDEDLAEKLYQLKVGSEIPPALYSVVAKVLIFIATMDEKWQAENGKYDAK
jgi:flagellar biosynthesis protein